MVANEIETSNKLEKYLRLCVDDVKAEILKKKNENRSMYSKLAHFKFVDTKTKNGRAESHDDRNLS